jgi:hypothetical protein
LMVVSLIAIRWSSLSSCRKMSWSSDKKHAAEGKGKKNSLSLCLHMPTQKTQMHPATTSGPPSTYVVSLLLPLGSRSPSCLHCSPISSLKKFLFGEMGTWWGR